MLAPFRGALWPGGICLAFLLAPVSPASAQAERTRRPVGADHYSAGSCPARQPAVLAALLALLPVGGDALVWVPAIVVFASTSQLGSTIFPLIRGAGMSASENLIRRLGLRYHWRDHRAGVADRHGRATAFRRRDAVAPAGHPWFVPDYTLRQAGPTMLGPVDHRAGLA